MMSSWKYPVAEPLFATVWTRELCEQPHDKPTALGTRFRFSDALNCSRRMVFDAMGVEKTDPIDPAGIHVTTIGTWIHEQIQAAVERTYPGATFEVVSGSDLVSGSADIVVEFEGRRILVEIKSIGGFAFTKAIGITQSRYKRGTPSGPRPSAIAQASLNALFNDCDEVVIVYIALEAISKQKAEALGLSMYERFTAEWEIPEEVWRPLAEEERFRIEGLDAVVESGYIPPGDYFDDEKWEWEQISPTDSRPKWTCSYCPHFTTCVAYEAGIEVVA